MSVAADEIAVVSGGSSGIGLAVTEHLLERGCRVAFFGQSAENIAAATKALARRFDESRILGRTADLLEDDDVEAFFDDVRTTWGAPTILICNAGISPKAPNGRVPLAGIDLREWDDVLRINLTGALLCLQNTLDGMSKARHGRIVLIGSVAARTLPRIAGAAYVASKSGLAGLARSVVSEYSAHGITANVVVPGRILTDMTGDARTPANRAALERIPAGRLGLPVDIARVVAFLVERNSGFINGAVIDVNGGEFCPP
jgi:3-oxoacyl-[acyl-carrier protein] reductase